MKNWSKRTPLTIIDVRPEEDFRSGHIPGAINIQWTKYTYVEGDKHLQLIPLWVIRLRLGLAGISIDDAIVVYGDQEYGWGEDGRFFWMFSYLGHERVQILNGGWNKWSLEGRNTTDKKQV